MTEEQLLRKVEVLETAHKAVRDVRHHDWKCHERFEQTEDPCECLEKAQEILFQAECTLIRLGLGE